MEQHHLLLPAKFGDVDGVYRFHPLICHMLDTASVADAMWDDVLPPGERSAIAEGLGVGDESARRWCAFLAGVHDLGKAAPAFLSHEAARPLWPALEPWFEHDLSLKPKAAHACGGEPISIPIDPGAVNRRPHACGGEPRPTNQPTPRRSSSPRVWG